MQFALLGGGGGYFKNHVNNANVLDMYSQVSGSQKYIMKIYNDGKIGQQRISDCLMLSTSQDGSGNQYFLRGSKNSTQFPVVVMMLYGFMKMVISIIITIHMDNNLISNLKKI